MRRTGYATLGSHYGVFSHFYVMGNLDQVVQFHTTPDYGCAHSCPVNDCIGSNLNVILYDNISCLGYLPELTFCCRCKSKSIRSYHGIGMNDAAFTYHAIIVHSHSRV